MFPRPSIRAPSADGDHTDLFQFHPKPLPTEVFILDSNAHHLSKIEHTTMTDISHAPNCLRSCCLTPEAKCKKHQKH